MALAASGDVWSGKEELPFGHNVMYLYTVLRYLLVPCVFSLCVLPRGVRARGKEKHEDDSCSGA